MRRHQQQSQLGEDIHSLAASNTSVASTLQVLVDSAAVSTKDDEKVEAMFNQANVQLLSALKKETIIPPAPGQRSKKIDFQEKVLKPSAAFAGTEAMEPLPMNERVRPRASMVRSIEQVFHIDTSDSEGEEDIKPTAV